MSWFILTFRLKQQIIGLLDYESRCNLRLSSKDDREAVDSTKRIFKTLKIKETQSELSEGKTIIRCDMDTLTIWLIGKENLTRIDRGWNGEIMEDASEIRHENRYEILNRLLSWISIKGFIEAETVDIEGIQCHAPQNFKPKCKNLTLFNVGNQYFQTWMPKFLEVSKKFEKLEIQINGEEEEYGVWSMISDTEVTKCIKLSHETRMTDEELEKFEALDFRVESTWVTVDGARKKLEKYLKFGTDSDILDLRIPEIDNFNAFEQLFSKNWTLKVIEREHLREEEYSGKIVRGFENVHGNLKPRQIDVFIYGETIRIWCGIYHPQPRFPCELYPF